MKKQKAQFLVKSITQKNNSYYGNPCYCLELEKDGILYIAKTASNASVGYKVSRQWIGEQVEVFFHFTKNGNMIIDY